MPRVPVRGAHQGPSLLRTLGLPEQRGRQRRLGSQDLWPLLPLECAPELKNLSLPCPSQALFGVREKGEADQAPGTVGPAVPEDRSALQ